MMNGTKKWGKKWITARRNYSWKSNIKKRKSDMLPLEDNEKVKEGKRLEILTPRKLLTRLSVLLLQIKAGNNSYKLNNEIRQILYLLY